MANTTLGSLLIRLRADTSAFAKGMGDARSVAFESSADIIESLKRVGEQFTKLKFNNATQIKRDFEIVGGVMAGVAVGIAAASIKIAKDVADQVEEMSKLSQSYGLTIQQVSQLRVASALTHVSLETMTVGMGRLAKAAAEVASTGQSTGGAFQSIGVRVTDTSGKLRPMNDLLTDVAGKFSKMQDGTTKTALAMQLFGRSGAALIPFLNRGSEGIREITELSEKLGLTWSEKDAAAARQLNETFDILQLKGDAFKENFAKGVIPDLDRLANGFFIADSSGKNLAQVLGNDVGSALVFVAKRLNEVVTLFRLFKVAVGDAASGALENVSKQPAWLSGLLPEVSLFAGLKKYDAENRGSDEQKIGKILDQYGVTAKALDTPYAPPKLSPPGGAPPDLTSPENMVKAQQELDRLLNEARQALNKEAKDPLATEISNIQHLKDEFEQFRAAHPERIWATINDAVEKLNAAQDRLREKQKASIDALTAEGAKAQIDLFGKTFSEPQSVTTPTVTGSVQKQAQTLKLDESQSVDERNRVALQIYEQTATTVQRYRDTVRTLNVELKNENITQSEYNRALQTAKDAAAGIVDPTARYNESLRETNQLLEENILTVYQKLEVERQLREQQAESLASSGGVKGGIQGGALKVQNEWQGSGKEAMNATVQAAHGMESAISSSFSQMIMGTKTVGQAFAEMGRGMLSSVVEACTQMLAKWIVTHVIMAAVSKMFGGGDDGTETAAAKKVAASAVSVQADAAVASADVFVQAIENIPFPANLGAAPALATFTHGEVTALSAFEHGGIVPETGLALMHQDEGVLTKPAMKFFGDLLSAHKDGSFLATPQMLATPRSTWDGVPQMPMSFNPAINLSVLRGLPSSNTSNVRAGDTVNYQGGDMHFHNTADPKEAARLAAKYVRQEFRTGGVIKVR